ncbi:alpha/beta hydrolase fold-domain-containing protein [Mycena galericulata]|nr:alpha/beta hydrolase fold-domain-containing protein [Mycena galericulata]
MSSKLHPDDIKAIPAPSGVFGASSTLTPKIGPLRSVGEDISKATSARKHIWDVLKLANLRQAFGVSFIVFLLITHLFLRVWPLDGGLSWRVKLTIRDRLPNLVREKSTLNWESCPDDPSFFCTFFAVPLDYLNSTRAVSTGDQAIIAMRLFPATGPGTSGHAILLKRGPSLSAIFHGKFDIVSWDPRGVNMSTPRISCHPTEFQRQLFALGQGDLEFYDLPVSAANITLLTASARALLLTELCRNAVGDKVLRSVTTVNVARDLEEMRKAVGEGGLLYWGFSYGTTLGATYAAMFPDNIHRMVLDGVVFTPEQYGSLFEHGISSGVSTSKVFDGFLSSCIDAGPSRCALLQNNTANASLLAERISKILSRLSTSPLPVTHPNSGAVPSILHPSDLILSIFATLLRPVNWASLASAIADLENGDGRAIAGLSGAGGRSWDLANVTDAERAENAGWGTGREMGADEADMAVSCGDAALFSEYGDDAWTHSWLDWRAKKDPVSPIASGRRMVDIFGKENARLLENNAYGHVHLLSSLFQVSVLTICRHCSVSQPSLCIDNAIRDYMIEGNLPAEGTICQPDEGISFPSQGNFGKLGVDNTRERSSWLFTL